MYSEHKHLGAEESISADGDSPQWQPVRAGSSLFSAGARNATSDAMRSVTVDTSSSKCAEWTPGRGSLFIVLPLRIVRSVSSPGGRDPVADAATMGRSAQVVASALVAARFLRIWLATGPLLVLAALLRP